MHAQNPTYYILPPSKPPSVKPNCAPDNDMYNAYNIFVFHNVHKIATIIDLLFCPLVLNNNGCKCELSGFEPGFAPTASQSRVGMKIGLQFSFHWSAPQTGGFCAGCSACQAGVQGSDSQSTCTGRAIEPKACYCNEALDASGSGVCFPLLLLNRASRQ